MILKLPIVAIKVIVLFRIFLRFMHLNFMHMNKNDDSNQLNLTTTQALQNSLKAR